MASGGMLPNDIVDFLAAREKYAPCVSLSWILIRKFSVVRS